MTIGEVAKRSGVATSALRFYEEQGLIHAERNDSGHRRYPRAVIRRVAFIVFAQRIGLSLEEIGAELAKLPRNHVPERSDWAKLSVAGRRAFATASPSSSGSRWASPSASAVAACRWTGVAWRIQATGPHAAVPARATGWNHRGRQTSGLRLASLRRLAATYVADPFYDPASQMGRPSTETVVTHFGSSRIV